MGQPGGPVSFFYRASVLCWPINIWAEVASFSPVVPSLLAVRPAVPASAVPRRSPPRREAMGAAVAGWTVAAVLLQVAGLSLFLYGFFPVKPTLRGFRSASPFASALLWFLSGCGIYGACFGCAVFGFVQWTGELPNAFVRSSQCWGAEAGASSGSAQISVQGKALLLLPLLV